ncbi:uncharacterized protein LOC130418090 isoform X2 [Triplophysa dalaica]|uniref:uncharacterized protein LOC130418090 isoform X2 n=2 Tax=Triplophysa dalaica TaxID=1582913 RepID=UPI0024DFFF9D|nr:uncharacterized protein LOC130418090 isoform X2 [Triplophysa dalaica]
MLGSCRVERMTSPTDPTPPPAGARSSAESVKDSYVTQLIRRLESLHMSTVVNTPQEQEPPICCSQTKPSKVLNQHNTAQMLSHRWHRLGLQPPILWSTQEHISDHYKSPVDIRTESENSPLQVTLTVSSRNKRTDEMNTVGNSHSSSLETCNRGLLEGNVTEHCSLNNSSRMSVECEDSDLSDLEKDNIPVFKWAAPVELDLRPDLVDKDLEFTEVAEEDQGYPEVLPIPLKDFSESSDAGLESKDPCLTAMVTRLLELEKLQAATLQKEQGKAVRSRPATALVRSANRLRRLESPCSQMNT